MLELRDLAQQNLWTQRVLFQFSAQNHILGEAEEVAVPSTSWTATRWTGGNSGSFPKQHGFPEKTTWVFFYGLPFSWRHFMGTHPRTSEPFSTPRRIPVILVVVVLGHTLQCSEFTSYGAQGWQGLKVDWLPVRQVCPSSVLLLWSWVPGHLDLLSFPTSHDLSPPFLLLSLIGPWASKFALSARRKMAGRCKSQI